MNRAFMWAFAGLGLICAVLSVFNVSLVINRSRDEKDIALLKQHIADRDTAEIATKRSDIKSAYGRCIGAIKFTAEANLIVQVTVKVLSDASETDERLAAESINPAYRRIHQAQAKRFRNQALALRPFPTVTPLQCREARDDALTALGHSG